jgi:hypothetical protein
MQLTVVVSSARVLSVIGVKVRDLYYITTLHENSSGHPHHLSVGIKDFYLKATCVSPVICLAAFIPSSVWMYSFPKF